MKSADIKLAVVGLGYVGLPLAVEFGRKKETLGFDINDERIRELSLGLDKTKEVSTENLKESINLKFSSDRTDLTQCSCFIICVPTPIDGNNQPDLKPLIAASEMVGSSLKKGDIVVYESTVYPGATEERCVPVLERSSGLVFNQDFFCGYSPERINPGDKEHRIDSIVKVTSGSTKDIARIVDDLYGEIITAGTYMATSIKVAEAAKVIENTQRDVNIALINELSIIFNKLGIDTEEVLKAAGTKWNFLPFRPGLVGGHCIGVDPYYLTYKAQSVGYHPEIILSGRALNDQMGTYISMQLIKKMANKNINIGSSKVLIMGLAFKENCPDIRNTRVLDIISELKDFGCDVDVYDPVVDKRDALSELDIELINRPDEKKYDAVIIAVSHDYFKNMGVSAINGFTKNKSVIYDLKFIFTKTESDIRL